MNGDQRSVSGQHDGHALSVERVIDAPAEAMFDSIRLVQSGFPATGTRDDFAGAWPDVLAELARRVSALGPHPMRTILGA
jgi:hypothetical protein